MAPYHNTRHRAGGTHDMMIEIFGVSDKIAHENRDPVQRGVNTSFLGHMFLAEEVPYSAS